MTDTHTRTHTRTHTHTHAHTHKHTQLEKPVMAQGNVEIWLGKLLNMALRSVHAVIRNAIVAIHDPNFELMEFLSSYPAQVSIVSMLHSGIS